MSRVTVLYGEEQVVLEGADGELIGDLIAANDLPIEQPCAGKGTCGRCKVLLEKGTAEPDSVESEHLTPGEIKMGTRLACRARIQGDAQIVLAPIEVYSNKIFKAGSRHTKMRDVPLGLAIDLGSTTVAAYLVMLDDGEVVAGGASLNQQRAYGADVISRLSAAVKSEDHRLRLQRLAVSSINQAINSLMLSESIMRRVTRVTVVGNVAMHHMFAGLPLETIAVMPFRPYAKDAILDNLDLLEGLLEEQAELRLPPLIGGFVGSDALACLAYFGFDAPPGPMLAVDLGTNGEVLLTDGEQIVAASTAAGPAFEGVNISCGMRAVDGAVVGAVLQGGGFAFEALGNEPPQGLTGTGLMQVVYKLLQAGVIEKSGRIADPPRIMADKIERVGSTRRIVLTPDGNIWLNQKDIRELQKAKGAIRAAIEVLMDTLSLEPEDLQKFILTGSFGGQLDVATVIGLGMIPQVSPEIVSAIPNGAGIGAAMFLSDEGFALGQRLAERTRQIDLDQSADFQSIFVDSLAFRPH